MPFQPSGKSFFYSSFKLFRTQINNFASRKMATKTPAVHTLVLVLAWAHTNGLTSPSEATPAARCAVQQVLRAYSAIDPVQVQFNWTTSFPFALARHRGCLCSECAYLGSCSSCLVSGVRWPLSLIPPKALVSKQLVHDRGHK